ncbi:MAG TPA: hypothetical protein PLK55_02645 [archaeon]|nr:hypothetical protein [archaeon]
MNSKYLLFQLFFIASIFVSLFIQKNLFLKVLLVCLLFLYGLLILPEFVYNRNKFLFIGSGFIILAILFLVVGYITNINYMIILSCVLVAFFYSSRVLFSTTYGEVIITSPRNIQVRILDVFHRPGKIYTIETTKKYPLKSIVSIRLATSISRKPTEIIELLCDNSKTLLETSKIQKKPKKVIKTRKDTNISRKKKKK